MSHTLYHQNKVDTPLYLPIHWGHAWHGPSWNPEDTGLWKWPLKIRSRHFSSSISKSTPQRNISSRYLKKTALAKASSHPKKGSRKVVLVKPSIPEDLDSLGIYIPRPANSGGKEVHRPFVSMIFSLGQTGVMDRRYQTHDPFDQWQKEGKHFVGRIKANTRKKAFKINDINPDSNIFYEVIVSYWALPFGLLSKPTLKAFMPPTVATGASKTAVITLSIGMITKNAAATNWLWPRKHRSTTTLCR